jgi:hypothetical protein
MKKAANPMDALVLANAAPRCTARSKRTGQPCKAPAQRGWSVCYYHGAGGGAPRGPAHGMYRTGRFTSESIERRREVAQLVRACRRAAGLVERK